MTTIEQEPESHPFPPFIPENATTLIVGSFPGMEQVKNKDNPEEWFYSAADNLFWKIVSDAFETELKTVQKKKEFCRKYGVGITDVFTKIKRKKRSNRDQWLTEVEYNKEIETIFKKAGIKKILFTSKFVQNHFKKAFPHIPNGTCLPSPSQAANIPISISEDFKNYIQENPDGNTYSFRVHKYRQMLQA